MKKKAFVLLFSLAIMSLVSVLTYQLLRMTYVGFHFDKAMVDRERAEMLALGGVNLAMAQLMVKEPKKGKEPRTTEEKKKYGLKGMLRRVLPTLNRWQEFELQQTVDGIDGNIRICISCEDGKINLNETFAFEKNDFHGGYKKFLQSLYFKGQDKSKGEIYKKLVEFFKTRKKKLDDISELHAGAITQVKSMFYKPPFVPKRKKDAKPNEDLALNDIFTIWGTKNTLEAPFLSDALCKMFGLRQPRAYDTTTKKDQFKTFIENFKQDQDQNTPEHWDTLKPLYEQKSEFKAWENKIFSTKFEPKVYSVLSSGKVGDVEQRLLAIIEKVEKPEEKQDPEKKNDDKKDDVKKQKRGKRIPKPFKVLRMYWI